MDLPDLPAEHEKDEATEVEKEDSNDNYSIWLKIIMERAKEISKDEGNPKLGIPPNYGWLLQMTEEMRKFDVRMKEALGKYQEKQKERNQLLTKLRKLEQPINETIKFIEEKFLNKKPSLAEIAKSATECEMEGRRDHARREAAAHRRNNQLRAANLNRGLNMDVDAQETSKSDLAFNLTSLDKALPTVSHRKKMPKMTSRSSRLEDAVVNTMKVNRLIRNRHSCSVDPDWKRKKQLDC